MSASDVNISGASASDLDDILALLAAVNLPRCSSAAFMHLDLTDYAPHP